MNTINSKHASDNYWREKVKTNTYKIEDRDRYRLFRFVNYNGKEVKVRDL